jgi:hypothetical protein
MDVQRFEAIAYAQAAKGVRFIQVSFVDRFEQKVANQQVKPKTYLYKVPVGLEDLGLSDLVLVQVFNGDFAIGQVVSFLEGPPQIDEYDYSKPLKWVVQKIDRVRSERLTEMDRQVLKAMSQVSLQARMQQLGAALGVDIMKIADAMDSPKILEG